MSKSNKNNQSRLVMVFVGVLVMIMLLANIISSNQEEIIELKYSEFKSAVESPSSENNRIVEATFKENHLTGVRQDRSIVRTYVPNDKDTRKFLQDHGVVLNFSEPEGESLLKSLFVSLLPILLIMGIIFFVMRSFQAGGGKAMSFGKSRAKMSKDNKPRITFKDIAGIDEAKEELGEVVEFLKEPKKFTRLGGRIPKGVLLIGSPGTGKTILARGVAGEAEVPFFSISGSDFVEMFVGVGASRVRDLFEQAKKHAPCIVFIDEIDAVGRQRGAGLGGGHDEREQTLNQLLVEMDGFEDNAGVIVVAATNRSDVLDPALLRPGRFDRRVQVPSPDIKGRLGILKVHSRKIPLADDVDLALIAQGTPGFTGADLENLMNESALTAAREDAKEISMNHIEVAKDKVLMGAERKSMIMSEKSKRVTAYHEAGHALVGLLSKVGDPVHKVSIIPRGGALGVTIMLPEEDRWTMSKEHAEAFILYAMGGRAAEELIFAQKTSGASDDLQKSTSIARKMVCKWGMSEKIGPQTIGRQEEEVFMGRAMAQQEHFSEKISQLVDEEVQTILTKIYNKALQILTDNKDKLEALAESLVIKETLDRSEMLRIIKGEDIVTDKERETFAKRKKNVGQALVGLDIVDTKKDSDKKLEESDSNINPTSKVKPEPSS
jgi:cell division protease FtsH